MLTQETPHVIKPQFTQRRFIPHGTPVRRPPVQVSRITTNTVNTTNTPYTPSTTSEIRRSSTISQQPGPSEVTARSGRIVQKPSYSPVNILKDPPQIATEGFSMVLRPEGYLE